MAQILTCGTKQLRVGSRQDLCWRDAEGELRNEAEGGLHADLS